VTEGVMGGNLDRLLRLADPAADHDLLAPRPGGGGDAAFAELVRRHGPTVLGVCRRVLRHEQDAEDAFQATFLVLARKAGSVRRGESLGAWLFGVARHVALRLRDKDRRRRRHEAAAGRPEATADPEAADWLGVLDEELGKLPDRYRTPLVACHLCGRTQEEAAGDLGLSLSTLRRRLDRGRELLRARLAGRGVTVPAGTVVAAAVVPRALAESAVRAVGGYLNGDRGSAPAALAQGVLAMMARVKQVKAVAAVLALGGAVALWQAAPGGGARADDPAAKGAPKDPNADPAATPKLGSKSDPSAAPKGRQAAEPPAGRADDRIRPGDRLRLRATDVFEADPINGVYVIEAGGTVALGPMYGGRVRVEGLTPEQAEAVVQKQLRLYARNAAVGITRADPADDRVGQLERRVQQLEQEVLELRAAIRDSQKGREKK
jgi:RNA polymerase sigma factor (sigma-70 family)